MRRPKRMQIDGLGVVSAGDRIAFTARCNRCDDGEHELVGTVLEIVPMRVPMLRVHWDEPWTIWGPGVVRGYRCRLLERRVPVQAEMFDEAGVR